MRKPALSQSSHVPGSKRGKRVEERLPAGPWLAGAAFVALAPLSCGHDWNAYDPRLGTSAGTSSTGGSGGTTSSTGGSGGATTSTSVTTTSTGSGMTCMPNLAMPCYSGAPGTAGKGVCKQGNAICQPDGLSYGPCLGEVTPIVEECGTAVDDDCNGIVNDHCATLSKQFGADGDQHPNAVAVDSQGNIIVVGFLDGSADFGGGKLVSAGGFDAFVVKMDKSGKHIWSKIFGDATDQEAVSVTTDSQNNVIVTGYFNGSIDPSGGALPARTSKGAEDIFAVKFDAAGKSVWTLSWGGVGSETGYGVAVDNEDHPILTGSFNSPTDFGVGLFNPVAGLDAFVLKLGANGAVSWVKTYGATSDDDGLAVTTGPLGHIFVTGTFDDQIDFGGGPIDNPGGTNVFVAELDKNGSYVWAKSYGGAGTQSVDSISRDAAGNLLLAGTFYTSADFGGGLVQSAGKEDVYVVKLAADGKHLWSHIWGDPESQEHATATFDPAGNVLFATSLEGKVDFGGGPLTNVGATGASDIVVVKLSGDNGAHVWSRRFGDPADQDLRGIATFPTNEFVITGEFSGKIDFGAGLLDNVSSDDAFVAVLPP